jgi:hypothetical protein
MSSRISWIEKALAIFRREAKLASDRKQAFARSKSGQVILLIFALFILYLILT